MHEPIVFFDGDYAFLSNFWHSPIEFDGLMVRTVEHAFQASKTLDRELRVTIATAATPARAKSLGRRVPLRPDWEQVKVEMMRTYLRRKFVSGSDFAERLVETASRDLIEGNTWGDQVWGVVNGRGQNLLGKLLMEIREELRHVAAVRVGSRR